MWIVLWRHIHGCAAIPFERIREVTVDPNGIMYYNCQKYECVGIFCEHQVSVAHAIFNHSGQVFLGFSHHDVATRYRTTYMHLAYKPNTPVHITAAFDHLVRNNPTGPK